MGRKKVAVRKQREVKYDSRLTFSVSDSTLAKIQAVRNDFNVTQSQAARILLDLAPLPSKPIQLSAEDVDGW
jgi:DNA-binding transcriptional regulator YiaG